MRKLFRSGIFRRMKLHDYLTKHGIKANAFARAVGTSQPAMSRYVRQLRIPPKDLVTRIFEATDGLVGPADFYELSEGGLVEHDAAAASEENDLVRTPADPLVAGATQEPA